MHDIKTLTFLFEFYAHTEDEVHGEYQDFDGLTLADALAKFSREYPNGRVLNTYVQVNREGMPV